MQISVNLQGKFLSPIFITIIILSCILGLIIYILLKNRKKIIKEDNIKIKFVSRDIVKEIKEKYIKELDKLESELQNGVMKQRRAYQKLSKVIRYFVFEMTNIKVQNYTLEEIEKLKMQVLYELVKEYYTPEFAKESIGDINSAIEKTRKVILKWN